MEVLDAINEQIDDILGVAHVHNSTYRNIYLTLSDALCSQLAVTLVDIYKKLCIKPKAGMGEQSDQIREISS